MDDKSQQTINYILAFSSISLTCTLLRTRNSAIADKPCESFVRMQWLDHPEMRPSPRTYVTELGHSMSNCSTDGSAAYPPPYSPSPHTEFRRCRSIKLWTYGVANLRDFGQWGSIPPCKTLNVWLLFVFNLCQLADGAMLILMLMCRNEKWSSATPISYRGYQIFGSSAYVLILFDLERPISVQ